MQTDAESQTSERAKLSAFVVAYNREAIIGTCLRALSFADEILVIDKSSTDATPAIAASLADRVIRVPWTPTVEETRAFAISQCAHDWILFLDDDECFSPEAIRFIDAELRAPRADLYRFPLRHYIMGRHDERAYYWPEEHVRLIRRDAVSFLPTVHGGMALHAASQYSVPVDSGACIHHLSHRDVAQWIEKSNRYTSQPDRKRSVQTASGIGRFAHERIDDWLARGDTSDPDGYPAAVALLRAIYDLIDRLKGWEEEAGIDGETLFRDACARLDAAYAAELAPLARPHRHEAPADAAPVAPADTTREAMPPRAAGEDALSRAVRALRDSVEAQREAIAAIRAERDSAIGARDAALAGGREQQARAEAEERTVAALRQAQDALTHRLEAAQASHATAITEAAAAQQAALAAERAAREQETMAVRAKLAESQTQLAATAHRLHTVESSTSWRLTGPLRRLLIRLGRA
jgi:hypothetical protein